MLRNQLNRLLFESGMSESELATRVRIDQSHLNRIKNGHVAPSLITALRIADGMGVSVDAIFHLDGRAIGSETVRAARLDRAPDEADRPGGQEPKGIVAERPSSLKRPQAPHPG